MPGTHRARRHFPLIPGSTNTSDRRRLADRSGARGDGRREPPGTNLLYGPREAVPMLPDEGQDNVFARHAQGEKRLR